MESYSPAMQADLQRELRASTPAQLIALRAYFEKRKGPGLALLLAELATRRPNPADTLPPGHCAHGRRITA